MKNFITRQSFFIISIYVWFLLGMVLGKKYSPWYALLCVFISFMNIIILLLVSEND